jgi:hypothetical protein
MGLKGYRLWVMGQLDSTCRAPPREHRPGLPQHHRRYPVRVDVEWHAHRHRQAQPPRVQRVPQPRRHERAPRSVDEGLRPCSRLFRLTWEA